MDESTILPKLYKIAGTGKIQEWNVSVHPSDGGGQIQISHGQQEGKKTVSVESITEGKNVGKVNETTPYQQAHLQAGSRWKKQLDKGYRETVEEAKKAAKAVSKPMLAHKWDDKKHLFKLGDMVVTQPKLDGMRCLASRENGAVSLLSRGGKPIESVPHINAELNAFMKDGDTWDGELYVHGMEFEKIISICKRKAKNLHPEYGTMQYHVYDVVSDKSYIDRFCPLVTLSDRSGIMRIVHDNILMVTDDFYNTIETEVLPHYEEKGYEGVILRRPDLPYEHKRSVQLIKVKSFQDEEFEIVGSEDGKAGSTKANLLQTFVLKTVNKKGEEETFKASLFGKEDVLRGMWARREEYVGELATCVFQEKSKYGLPRFPKVKAIRGKEDLS